MALEIGTTQANSGMAKAIYDEINTQLSPPLDGTPAGDMGKIRDSWKKLAYAIAEGVISHIKSNMEIKGIETSGNINAAVAGNTATQAGVVFTQSNDGSGLVE